MEIERLKRVDNEAAVQRELHGELVEAIRAGERVHGEQLEKMNAGQEAQVNAIGEAEHRWRVSIDGEFLLSVVLGRCS